MKGYPVLCVGTTDRNKAYHPIGLAVVMGETEADYKFLFQSTRDVVEKVFGHQYRARYLIADGAPAITNGFNAVFETDDEEEQQPVRIMCWAHVVRNIRPKLQMVDNQHRHALRSDIDIIQLSTSPEMFATANTLFFNKWKAKNNKTVDAFLAYYRKTWASGGLTGWCEGVAPLLPSTNNALEAYNRVIKVHIPSRLSVGDFLNEICTKVLKDWSTKHNPDKPNSVTFASRLVLEDSDPVLVEAFQWSVLVGEQIFILKRNGESRYYTLNNPTKDGHQLTKDSCKAFLRSLENLDWETFDRFAQMTQTYVEIDLDKLNFMNSKCSCGHYFKNYT